MVPLPLMDLSIVAILVLSMTRSKAFVIASVSVLALTIFLTRLILSCSRMNCFLVFITQSGALCTFDIAFKPGAQGAKAAYLSIPSNDPDTPVHKAVKLAGTG